VSRLAGRLRATEDHWTISNLSRQSTYVVENPEGGGEFLKVAPRRLDMPVPFEFARVVLPAAHISASFQVFAPQHLYTDVDDPQGRSDTRRPPPRSRWTRPPSQRDAHKNKRERCIDVPSPSTAYLRAAAEPVPHSGA
jgi:hypothetical protein